MAGVFEYEIQSDQICSKDGNLSMLDEGIPSLTETQSIKIGDIIAAMPTDEETGTQDFAHVLPHVGYIKEEQSNFDSGPTSSNLLHFAWSETRTTEEESVSTEATTSLQEMINNMGQFLVSGIGTENDVESVSPWSDVRDFQNQITESCSFRNTSDIQVFGECGQFNETCNYGQVPAMSSCNAHQPCSNISVVQNIREMEELSRTFEKVECIEAGGPALSDPEAVHELTKQEERKQKRRERNRLCSRQFRQKQKVKEHTLTEGLRIKKAKLKDLRLKLEAASKMLFRIVSSSAACNKGRGMITAVAGLVNKENWPGGLQVVFSNANQVKQ